jgi:hypothetical protein
MKGKIFMFLFALPFFGIGMWMGISALGHAADAWQMRAWAPVDARLGSAGVETRRGDDADTYEAYAAYTYEWQGRVYHGNRVSISSGADNIGEFQQNLGRRLAGAWQRGETITVRVDPAEPSSSVIDPNIRWALVGFKTIFFLVFGGFGAGLLYVVFRPDARARGSAGTPVGEPWLLRKAWQTATIRSGSRASMWFAWGFAFFWNAISAPLPVVIYREVVDKENLLALIGLVFPLVGAGLLAWAIRRSLEWRRFGSAPVRLDPFPGAIGGHVGGTIDIDLPYDPAARFSLTLTSLHSEVSGSGKNRSRRERPKWQDSQVAHSRSGPHGTTLTFRFDVPGDLDESDAAPEGDDYHLWRLNLKADVPGTDIDRDYEIPVYATGETSQYLSAFSIDEARREQRRTDIDLVRRIVRLQQDVDGKRMLFPAGRNVAGGIGGTLFGSTFAAIGWFLITRQDHWFMGGIFGLIGVLVATYSIYLVSNSLEIARSGDTVRTVRRLMGIPIVRRSMRRQDFLRFRKSSTMSTQSGSKHVMYYTLFAVDSRGQELVVGEGFRGASQADAASALIADEFGLRTNRDAELQKTDFVPYNVLTAD